MTINENFLNLKENYLFSEVARKVEAYASAHPGKKIIRLGIGDVTRPLPGAVIAAMKAACDEMGEERSFRGYAEEQGYPFLRRSIADYYEKKGIALDLSEIFISDGAKSDLGNILDLFSPDNTVLIPDPVYPAYVDANLIDGRSIFYMDANESNGFLPLPDDIAPLTNKLKADIIYLCSPNNPTGAAYTKEMLLAWVEYAAGNDALILFDSAYEAFVSDASLPTSIYEVAGARDCAIEFCSLSKTAGFTGTRCAYTVVPGTLARGGALLNKLWLRRQSTKFNGVSYIVQRGAEAVFSPAGMAQVAENIAYYRKNARLIASTLDALGIWYCGGVNSPYIWLRCPGGRSSWEFFDFLLGEAGIVGTPGSGFGRNGEGYFRLTAFGSHENTEEAMERLRSCAKAT